MQIQHKYNSTVTWGKLIFQEERGPCLAAVALQLFQTQLLEQMQIQHKYNNTMSVINQYFKEGSLSLSC